MRDKQNPKKKQTQKKPGNVLVLTNQEIFQTAEPLSKLLQEKIHVRVSYNLAKMASVLQTHLKVVQDTRNAVIKKYGRPDPNNPQQTSVPAMIEKLDGKGKPVKENGEPFMVPNPDFDKFIDELTELMATEETVDFGKLEIPVKLPEKVAASCPKCHTNMDKALEVEPGTLLALEKLVTLD